MARYGVVLHTPWEGNTTIPKTFASAEKARKFAAKLARDTDITANAAIFKVGSTYKEWLF